MTIDVWYDRHIRLWTAIRKDDASNQVGIAGYGTSKDLAIANLSE